VEVGGVTDRVMIESALAAYSYVLANISAIMHELR
jgi:hypothetical protein